MPNQLIHETSPYLLQHAHNPVEWYPWGQEALERARAEDKPILLSVGYSACHWCHVMERESFEDPQIAGLMNESFVCIKVDREERPDIDSIYMAAVQAMTGRGGWPMTVFLTPEGKPFYGGTYFPPEDRHGMPGFPRVIEAVARTYREDRGKVARATDQLLQHIQPASSSVQSPEPLTADVLSQAYRAVAGQFDEQDGGVGHAPKFPQPMTYEFLLRYYLRSRDPEALGMVELTLEKMATGGIYDQIGGGFHRYSTDSSWLVPHFEKMLYDNALLGRLYLHAYQVTGKPLYRRIVEEILDYVLREMTDPSGGFYSAQDADSEGIEGKFFLWQPEEIVSVLGRGDGEVINRHFGVTPQGNFEHANILHVKAAATAAGADEDKLAEVMRRCKLKLLEARERRVHPGRDNKVLAAWNGLMLQAFAEAAAVLGRADYAVAAERNATFLLASLRQGNRLLRSYKDGQAKLKGYLEDYAFLIGGLISLHEFSLDSRWLQEAIDLGSSMVDLFWDEASGQLYDTGRDHEALIIRPRDLADNAIPCGSSMAAEVMLRLAVITGDATLQQRGLAALRSARELMARYPTGAGQWLCALDFYLTPSREIVILGGSEAPATKALAAEVYCRFMPNRVLVAHVGDAALAGLPLMKGKSQVNGRPTAFVCQDYACQRPVTEPVELAEQLAQ